ncbi:hypothetical protein GCM10010468_52810 [Actinocorallia longicatena]|uniref:Novel STAND NTPase 1 domain-containing protein n=1 Tax=Actinocorallia longicatena TaxID=111803 RepID=A0ABP6QEX1_9ACTN
MTILYAKSGAGRTSLLSAGVLPRFANVCALGNPTDGMTVPLATVPNENRYALSVLSTWQPEAAPSWMVGLSVSGFFRRRFDSRWFGPPAEPLIAIDAAERLFSRISGREGERTRFLADLGEALRERPDAHLLLSVREDCLPEAVRFARRAVGEPRSYELATLSREAALEVVGEPAGFPRPIAERLIGELITVRVDGRPDRRTARVEPSLLQAVCTRDPAPPFEPSVDEALAEHVSGELAAVAEGHGLKTPRIARWFGDTFVAGSGETLVVREEDGRTAGMDNAVLRALEDRHLVTTTRHGDGPRCYRLADERLVRPVQHLPLRTPPAIGPTAEEGLRAARAALFHRDHTTAIRRAEAVLGASGPSELRIRAEAGTILGDAAFEQGAVEKAIEHYVQAASLLEALQDTIGVGRLLAATGRLKLQRPRNAPADAIADLQAAARRIPGDPLIQTVLGRALWQAGQLRAALAAVNEALAHDGELPEALRTRGELLAELGDRESAEAALRDLDRVDADLAHPSSGAARALALATTGRIDAAHRALEPALAEGGDSGPVLYRAARVEKISGDLYSAVRLAARAVAAKDPPLPEHQRLAAGLLRDHR